MNYLGSLKGSDVFLARGYNRPNRGSAAKIPTLIHEGVKLASFEEKERAFAQVLFLEPPDGIYVVPGSFQSRFSLGELTSAEMEEVFYDSKTTSARGTDGYNHLFLQNVYAVTSQWLFPFFKALIRVGYHPNAWKDAKAVILAKPNKPSYSVPKAFRPISLLKCLSKNLEKIWSRRIRFILEAQQILHPTQMGSRQKRSATDAVFALMHEVDLARGQKRKVSTLFADVSAAFPHVIKAQLVKLMVHHGFPREVIAWTECWMTDRSITMLFDGQISRP